MTLRDQLAELNAALTTAHNDRRLRSLRPVVDEGPSERRASHWMRMGMRDRLRVIVSTLGGKR